MILSLGTNRHCVPFLIASAIPCTAANGEGILEYDILKYDLPMINCFSVCR
jgi:hypothetical protein